MPAVASLHEHPAFKNRRSKKTPPKHKIHEPPKRPYRLEATHGSYTITLHAAYSGPQSAIRGAADRLARGATEVQLFDAITRELLAEGMREGLSITMRQGRNLAKTIQHDAPLSWVRTERVTRDAKVARGGE